MKASYLYRWLRSSIGFQDRRQNASHDPPHFVRIAQQQTQENANWPLLWHSEHTQRSQKQAKEVEEGNDRSPAPGDNKAVRERRGTNHELRVTSHETTYESLITNHIPIDFRL